MNVNSEKSNRSTRLMERTCRIIEDHGRIVLRKNSDDWYLGHWTNIAAGIDSVSWARRNVALEFMTLELAYVVAPLYGCHVVVVYPKKKDKEV